MVWLVNFSISHLFHAMMCNNPNGHDLSLFKRFVFIRGTSLLKTMEGAYVGGICMLVAPSFFSSVLLFWVLGAT